MDSINGLTLIGLTGPSGAGKAVVASLFAERGIPSVDTDAVYHTLLEPPSPCLDALREAFSNAIIRPDGTLDRPALSALVFEPTPQGKERRSRLNDITHRFILQRSHELLCQYAADGAKIAILDAPLLIEAGLASVCDHVIAVLADRDLRFRRLTERDGRSGQQINARLNAQPDDDFYRRHADFVIENNGSPEALRSAVQAICSRLEDPTCK